MKENESSLPGEKGIFPDSLMELLILLELIDHNGSQEPEEEEETEMGEGPDDEDGL